MNPTFNGRTAGLLFVAVGWTLFLALVGSPEILLFTTPVFLLAAPLALGRYVGEELVGRLARTVRPARRGRGTQPPSGHEAARDSILGALLIASNLAGRAPPAFAA
ncbi:MAG: hypothetical protein JJE13_07350 [Thermoleophilia bacterium]|nr:hypothetical protein [Thermoleophilia bacterium]